MHIIRFSHKVRQQHEKKKKHELIQIDANHKYFFSSSKSILSKLAQNYVGLQTLCYHTLAIILCQFMFDFQK